MAKFVATRNYEHTLNRIENHIFSTTESLESVRSFLDEHDRALMFIAENPKTPAIHPATGEQSWNFGDGRFRLFFKCVESNSHEITVYLTHLIDNKEANLLVYPTNKIPTYKED